MLDKWLTERLQVREHKNLYRSLQKENTLLDFTSNDYLGLARSEHLHEQISKALERLPVRNGSTGSRLLSGNTSLAEEVEGQLSGIFKSEATLLFNSGYTANLAVLSSIPQKDDTIVYDERSHASIKDGARLSLAKKFSFRHNDLEDLRQKLSRSSGRVFVVVESIYSMDGDECPLSELVALAKEKDITIILDEAHSTGVRGPNGAGVAVEQNLQDDIAIRIYTFGKAMGVCGACVSGSQPLVRYLVNFARPFIYTTAPSQHHVVSIACAFDYLEDMAALQDTLRRRIDTFLGNIAYKNHGNESKSAIQTLIVPGNENVRETAARLQAAGFDVRPILSPTVPAGFERLRICLHTFNTSDDIVGLTKHLNLEAERASKF